ncbi:MAG: FG-GAP repeat domain-containing protein [Saprospiraceae bacterium]
MKNLLPLIFSFLFALQSFGQTTFSEQAGSWNLDLGGLKDGGHSFADFDGDGDLDVLLNTENSTYHTRLYRNNGNNTFSDVTPSLAPDLLTDIRERSAVWGDLNNDGKLDFIRNTGSGGARNILVYLQDPNTGVFGDGIGGSGAIEIGNTGTDDLMIVNGLNAEGIGMVDFDGDGDLDIIFDNHNYGIDVLRNNYIDHTTNAVVNPTAANLFTHATPGTTAILGLSQSATDGDYGSFTDVNDDGWVDIFMRKRDENDFFLNQGGTFINGSDLAQASNNNKGSVALYDFDNDGDFDAFWTTEGDNQIFRNDGPGTWTPLGSGGTTGIPVSFSTEIDEVACGDIDNDGDVDILLVGDNRSFLYINNLNSPSGGVGTGTAMTFTLDAVQSFNSGVDGEGTTMIDIDKDGDLDIYMNVRSSDNQLWINNLYNSSTAETNKTYMFVEVLEDRTFMQSNKERPALGATIVLLDCDNNVLSGVREVNGGAGHGCQVPDKVHFGLPWGANYNYKVLVKYPNYDNGTVTRKEVIRWINPSKETTFPVTTTVRSTDADEACPAVLEICDNGLDDDGDLLVDCADSDCGGVTITNVTVGSCIDHPYADVTALDVTVSWLTPAPNKQIEVTIDYKTEYIDVPGGATSPTTVSFLVPADGSTNNSITANFSEYTCQATTTYNAANACSSDELGCSILYICGDSKGGDADAFDHGLMTYIDGINGNAILIGALSKNVGGQGLYDPMNTSTLTPYDIDTFDIVLVSATTWGDISSTLKTELKETEANVLLMSQDILVDLAMASSKSYATQTHAYSDNTTQVELYNFNNSNPHWAELIGWGNYHSTTADAYLWKNQWDAGSNIGGVFFHYEATDILGGVPNTHGARTFLGYMMDGVYWNDDTNMGVTPVPQADWFDPIRHLTQNGKLYLDQAIEKAAVGCAIEDCTNGIDDDGDGLIDCDDPDCQADTPESISND